MSVRRTNVQFNDFYCLNCGKKSFSLPRKTCHQHEQFHRKKLYCPNCRIVCNSIEIKTENDRWQFLEDYQNGVYNNEKEDIIYYGRMPGVR